MPGSIFLLDDQGRLQSLSEQGHQTEDAFQHLLECYPQLLAGELIDQENPRRWLLVTREIGIPSERDGADRWALDHLFLDQDGIPTLVEVKRSSDSRIRREVVGQMLDYAANCLAYWSQDHIQQRYEARIQERGGDPEEELKAFLDGADRPYEAFWQDVRTNLKAGRLRLLFVADEIPAELRRIVEFLNSQMNQTEVLAVEIKQYAGSGVRTSYHASSAAPLAPPPRKAAVDRKDPGTSNHISTNSHVSAVG